MSARVGSGWQTVLADLSIILFMITASAVSQAREDPPAFSGGFAMADPVAVWRPSPAGPTLSQWLSAQQPDSRLRLTLFVHAPAGDEGEALGLARAAAPNARVMIDREPGPPLEAILAFDQTTLPVQRTTP